MWAKSGWPVTGQSEVNSGQVKRTIVGGPSVREKGTVSRTALSGDLGVSTFAPSWVRLSVMVMALLLCGRL
jgi:hypothetical protein